MLGIVDLSGSFLYENSFMTAGFGHLDDYIDCLGKLVEEGIKALGKGYEIEGIGIGAPNGNIYKGTVEFAPNMPWEGVLPIVKKLGKIRKEKIVLANDADAAAIGEMIYGGAKGMRDFVVTTLGTGLGSGFVANGTLITGHDGFAGELGHVIVDPFGRVCGCGRNGCLERYVSANGLKSTVCELLSETKAKSALSSVVNDGLTAPMITEAARKGDKIALKAFEYTGEIFGRKLADVVAITGPEAIFITGGLAGAGDLLLIPTIKHMENNLMNVFKNKVKILLSSLGGNAGVLGAAALVWKNAQVGDH